MTVEVDPFDLPEWLGEEEVVWTAAAGLTGARVAGTLAGATSELPCDLLGVDEAFPAAVTDPETRLAAHRSWRHGQLLLATYDDRLTLLVPVREFSADLVLEVLHRFARAVGADPAAYAARLRLADRRR